jgi:hypothetical protein
MAKKKAAKKKITREVVCTYCTPFPGAGVSEKPASESVALQGADFTLPFTAHAGKPSSRGGCGSPAAGGCRPNTLDRNHPHDGQPPPSRRRIEL